MSQWLFTEVVVRHSIKLFSYMKTLKEIRLLLRNSQEMCLFSYLRNVTV